MATLRSRSDRSQSLVRYAAAAMLTPAAAVKVRSVIRRLRMKPSIPFDDSSSFSPVGCRTAAALCTKGQF